MSETAGAAASLLAPGLARRLACFLYEGVLLFGVIMIASLAYAVITDQRHALQGSLGLQVLLFLVLGLYFVGFWSRQGQTLAMRTWKIRLTKADGQPVGLARAACRYLLSWLWFMPALAWLHFSGLKGAGMALVAVLVGVLAYAATALLQPQRQFWHDMACQTRLTGVKPHVGA